MRYVYFLRSLRDPEQKYTGSTSDLKKRLAEHNNGDSTHANKFKPWKRVAYFAFEDAKKANALQTEAHGFLQGGHAVFGWARGAVVILYGEFSVRGAAEAMAVNFDRSCHEYDLGKEGFKYG
ncbi:MAG: GIY-YIG nuclease family protein [Proteobacteria bacterium]|nr:GIY-YIG nuclease family protein [Pseudomonadota bacterium]